ALLADVARARRRLTRGAHGGGLLLERLDLRVDGGDVLARARGLLALLLELADLRRQRGRLLLRIHLRRPGLAAHRAAVGPDGVRAVVVDARLGHELLDLAEAPGARHLERDAHALGQ